MDKARRLVTIGQAADELQVCERTVRRYISQGRLKGVRLGERLIRIERASLDALTTPVGGAR